MMEVRGSITDRPWGITLGAIAARRHTGQLTVESDGKRYGIAFDDGAIVAATSPLAADAIARIALTNHFITSTQVTDITRRLALSPDRDEVEVLVDTIRCSPDHAGKLRRRLVAQRVARTFSLEHGDFVLDDRITLPVASGVAIDHRYAIYLGARTNLSEQRLIDDLRRLGSHFVLKPEAIDELPFFDFEPSAHPVLEALKAGTSLPELEASNRELDPRFVQAIIYALVSCTACEISPRTAPPQPSPPRPAPPTPRDPSAPRLPAESGDPPTSSSARVHTPISPSTSWASARSPRAYSSTTAQDTGTNTPAATRPRAQTDHGSSRPLPGPTPAHARPPTPAGPTLAHSPTLAGPTPTGRPPHPMPNPTAGATSATRSRTPTGTSPHPIPDRTATSTATRSRTPTGTSPHPIPDRTATSTAARSRTPTGTPPHPMPGPTAAITAQLTSPDAGLPNRAAAPRTTPPEPGDGLNLTESPTPLAASSTAKPRAVMFGEPQPPRAGVASAPSAPGAIGLSASSPRPAVPRVPTSDADVVRSFADQRTPSGFSEQRTPGFTVQHTPGFTVQHTPADQRTPTNQSGVRTPSSGPTPSRVSTDTAVTAEEAFKRGDLAMKRDQPGEAILAYKTACDLNPNEVDYAAMLAWAMFCAAGDKAAIGAETRKALERAVFKSYRPERARFYLGRVERMLGRDKEALHHFQEVLALKPNHADAASEIRAIEARLQAASKAGTGLFGRKR